MREGRARWVSPFGGATYNAARSRTGIRVDAVTRRRLGWLGIAVGAIVLTFGVLAVHYTSLDPQDSLGRDQFSWVPRGWQWIILSKMVAFGGSQIAIAGIILGWLWKEELTWARATVGAAIFTLQVTLYFGVVPNEWLSLTQGEFEWTSQNIWFTVPEWLVLNNEVQISFAAVKDVVSAGYSTGLLGAMLVGMYMWQERAKKAREAKPQPVSTYGRPIVRGER